MEIIPEKVRKARSRTTLITFVFIGFMLFFTWKLTEMSSHGIKDINGSDTAIVTFKTQDFYISENSFVVFKELINISGENSRNESEDNKDLDYIAYGFTGLNGMKAIQETEVTTPIKIAFISEIEKGNFEIGIFKDKNFVRILKAGENGKITLSEPGIYTIVISGESAKGRIIVQRGIN